MQPQRAAPSASASLAATKAFVKNQESHGDLSNAAAAAALRTHVTTPTPVGDTITKRMVRRGSTSSNGSNRPQPGPPGQLRRQSSSGSMTERSFRAPSPGRQPEMQAPPVPPVPKNLQETSGGHRRASSLEPVYRGQSPGPRGGGRGVSLDRGANPNGRGQRPASHLAQVSEEDEAARLVNFSRPMSPGMPTTKQNPSPPTSHGWFGGPVVNQAAVQRMSSTSRPDTSSGVSGYSPQNGQRWVQAAAERPVSTHQISHGVQGTRLASGSMHARPSGTAVQSKSFLPKQPSGPVDPNSPNAIYDPSTRTFIHKQDAMARHRELHEEPEQPAQQYVTQHIDHQSPHPVAQQHRQQRSPSPPRQHAYVGPSTASQRRDDLPQLDTAAQRTTYTPQSVAPRTPEPHASALSQRRNSDDFADAEIQPQQYVGTSHHYEHATAREPERTENNASPSTRVNQDSSYPRLATPLIPAPANSAPAQGRGNNRTAQDRTLSLSPSRNAHFAPMAVELSGTKHEPLPRSISPAKSALKSSPSVSRRSHSPVASNGRLTSKSASSEASDATSDDGSRKKKKTVRVSFEQTPIVAGTSAYSEADAPTSPPGLSASKWSPTAEKEDEFEDFMKPRAALPVFGSIRDRERRPQDEVAEKITETVTTTPLSASVGSIEPAHASTDLALGNIVAQDFAQKSKPTNDPLPPEVTTVEGSGYVSDSSEDSDAQKHGDAVETWHESPAPEPKSLTLPGVVRSSPSDRVSEQIVEVPQLSVQPATPSPYERPEPQYQSMMIPGGWDDDVPEIHRQGAVGGSTVPTQSTPSQQPATVLPEQQQEDEDLTDDNSSVYSDAYEDQSDGEGGFASIDALMGSSVAASPAGLMSSRYAEKSPTESPTSKEQRRTITDEDGDSDATATGDWNAAQQHWSGLNASRKQPQSDDVSVERPSHTESVIARVMAAPVVPTAQYSTAESTPERKVTTEPNQRISTSSQGSQPSSKPLKSALKKTTATQPTPAVAPQIRQSMRGPPPQERPVPETHMKKTMRGATGPTSRAEPSMRSSMRGGPDPASRAQPQMRKSMRGSDAPPPSYNMALAASQHNPANVESKPPRGALQKRHIPTAVAAPKPRPQSMPAKQAVAPVPTYDSDSDASASSFQRSRGRASRNQGGRYTMRGSMRQDAAPTMRASAPAPAVSQVRSISPPGSPSPALRKSMRPSSPTPEAPKSSRFSIRSLSPMGRFKNSKGPEFRPSSPIQPPPPMPVLSKQQKQPKQIKQSMQKAPAAKAPAPKASTAKPFMSRFADSSDEDDDHQPRRFQSRFADSDDDEPESYKLPPGLAPVRGIPKRQGEEDGDSTDLEEEADDQPKNNSVPATPPGAATNGVSNTKFNVSASGEGAVLATGSLRDSKHAPALPSFDAGSKTKTKRGFFGLGKKKASVAKFDAPETKAAPDEIPMPPSQRNREVGLPLTPIDEDKDFGSPVSPIGESPQSKKLPKLQRRVTPEWPLPSPPVIGSEERPMSSDGIVPRRPRFQNRQSSQMSNITAPIVDTQGRSVSYGRTGKKKKFQGLRRVFGLND